VLLVDKHLFVGVAELENLLADPRASTLAPKLELAFNFSSELSTLVLKRKGPIFFVSLLVFSKIVISINSPHLD